MAAQGRPAVVQQPEAVASSLAALEGRPFLPARSPSFTRRARLDALCATLVAPLGGAVVVLVSTRDDAPLTTAILAFLVLACSAAVVRPQALRAAFCPLMGQFYALVHPALGVGALLALQLTTGRPSVAALHLLTVGAVVLLLAHPGGVLLRLLGRRLPPVRAAYIGPPAAATRLARAVRCAADHRYEIVGHVAEAGRPAADGSPWLGRPSDLRSLIVRHRIELLVLGPGAPRLDVFEELAGSCLHLPVRLAEAPDFCEEAFGHVPMSEIDATWFQHLLHPSFAPSSRLVKRSIDVAVGAALAVVALPVIAVLAALVRRDGGPAFFVQPRIGEQGRTFPLLKLRTMRVGSSPAWAAEDDDRVTRIGRILRRTHVDELPQLLNVLRGDMSLVGPRPEQPGYVTRLERQLPFYDRRHLIKPGITGWAALRCGYAGSDAGSAWKLCHDLYYIEHRSVGFDLLILAETAAELLTGRGVTAEQSRSMLDVQLATSRLPDAAAAAPAVLPAASRGEL